MANNRMFIVCHVCGSHKMIAKYYPSDGWFFMCLPTGGISVQINNAAQIGELLEHQAETARNGSADCFNKWFEEHRHDNFSSEGPTHYGLSDEYGLEDYKNVHKPLQPTTQSVAPVVSQPTAQIAG